MQERAQEVIDKVKDLEIDEERKNQMVEKLKEWKSDSHAESNTLAVTFENFWLELEPIFAELGFA